MKSLQQVSADYEEFKKRSERIKNPRTIAEKLERIRKLEILTEKDEALPRHRQELCKLRQQTEAFDSIPMHSPTRDWLDKLPLERRAEILNTSRLQYTLRRDHRGKVNPRHLLFGFRPGRLSDEDQKLVDTYRMIQEVRDIIDDHMKEASNG
jgi:hypothetical protein